MYEKHWPKTETARWFQNDGYCYCCDSKTQFVATSDWWRDDYRCANCNSIPRERALMFWITLPLVPLNVSDGILPQETDLFRSLLSLYFATLKSRLFPK